MRLQNIAIALVVIVAMGCSKGDSLDAILPDGFVAGDTPISFTTEWSSLASRATEVVSSSGFSSGTSMGILACYHGSGSYDAASFTPNFMYDQQVDYDGTSWSYTPMKYFSNTSSDKYTFFGYYPYSKVTLSDNATSGYPTLSYTPSTNVSEHEDLMTASLIGEESSESGISLSFDHTLTMVTFSANHSGSDDDLVQITRLTLSGTRLCGTGSFTATGFEWGAIEGESQEYTITESDGEIKTFSVPDDSMSCEEDVFTLVSATAGVMMLHPQSIASGQLTLTVEYSVDGEAEEDPVTCTIPFDHTYGMSSVINYQFSIEIGGDIQVVKWTVLDITDEVLDELGFLVLDYDATLDNDDDVEDDTVGYEVKDYDESYDISDKVLSY